MELLELLNYLESKGISPTVEGGRLVLRGDLFSITPDIDSAIIQHKAELINLLRHPPDPQPAPAQVSPPPYVKRCEQCGGSDWGCTGALPDGCEVWSCLTCWSSTSPTCSTCQGHNLVYDQVGPYCVDCRSRPGEKPQTGTAKEPVSVKVGWSSEKGYLQLKNPLTGETADILAKGAPRWLFDRIPRRSKQKPHAGA